MDALVTRVQVAVAAVNGMPFALLTGVSNVGIPYALAVEND
jgi:hypothetical protein